MSSSHDFSNIACARHNLCNTEDDINGFKKNVDEVHENKV
jgi:hypothetical protein